MVMRSALAAVLLTLVFAATLGVSLAATGDNALKIDTQVTHEAQELDTAPTDALVVGFNWFGHAEPFLIASAVIGVALAVRRRFADATFVVIAAMLAQGLNAALKFYFASPRPPASLTVGSEQASGLGFPSGHTMSIVVLSICLGFLAWRNSNVHWQRLAVVAAGGFAVLAMGFSRIHVGQHWPTDVLGAYLWGMLVAVTLIYAYLAMREPSSGRAVRHLTEGDPVAYRLQPVAEYDPILGVCARRYELHPTNVHPRSRR